MIAIAKELEGDPQLLLNALQTRGDPRLRGIHAKKVEQLRQFLTENGFIDHRPILTESELTLRALTTPAANQLPDGVAKACLHRWWHWAC